MIFDNLKNLKKYGCIPYSDAIIEFINNNDVSGLSEGDIDILGDDLYVKVLRYIPMNATENNFEVHNIYTDIQLVIKGMELIQVVNPKYLKETTEYNEQGDFQFFSADKCISEVVVRENDFIVFSPGEAHKPGCCFQQLKDPVFKLVFKAKTI